MRKLKLIGLSALSVLAVSAVSASAANAAEGTAVVGGGGSAGYTATQTGGGHTFTLVGGRVLSCTNATFSGSVTNGNSFVTASPSYTGCDVKIGASTLPATVITGTCTYKFYDLTTTAANTYSALTDLACPSGDVSIRVYANHTNHTSNTRLCEYTITPKVAMTGVHITDNANNTLNIKATNVAVPTERVFGTVGNCGEASFNSSYNGDTIATPSAGDTIDLDD